MQEVMELLFMSYTASMDWFMQLVDGVDGLGVWLSASLLYSFYRFILGPMFGPAASDNASKSYNAFKRRKE